MLSCGVRETKADRWQNGTATHSAASVAAAIELAQPELAASRARQIEAARGGAVRVDRKRPCSGR
jgi:hypothetical protein